MFTVHGPSQRFCDGLTRRSFLRLGALGASLTLADVLRLQATAGTATSSSKSVIMINLPGGPSHMDMYDLKPEAPVEYRGEFKPIKTNVPGVHICELFPRQARMWDKFAVIRSVRGGQEHSDAQTNTGYHEFENRTAHHPAVGAVVSRLRSSHTADIPPFVSLRGMSAGTEPGFLGVAHRPFTTDGATRRNLRLSGTVGQMKDRQSLLTSFDSVRREIDTTGTMRGIDRFQERAVDMVFSGKVRKALDLSREEPRSRERYRGYQVEQFLTARRLVEAGVGCITLNYGGWDTHSENFKTLRRQLPPLDLGLSHLVQDLHDRGMQNDVLIIMWGEFGRTPKVGDSTPDGRGHWPPVMSALLAGGGLKMGQAIGSSSARGETPKDRPYTVQRVLSTVYHTLGIDPGRTFPNGSGRPMYLLDDRKPVSELI
jgi:hypothetical protein